MDNFVEALHDGLQKINSNYAKMFFLEEMLGRSYKL